MEAVSSTRNSTCYPVVIVSPWQASSNIDTDHRISSRVEFPGANGDDDNNDDDDDDDDENDGISAARRRSRRE
jgi:hypothetical protein